MKKFGGLAAFVVAALFVAPPAPAAAQLYISRPGALVLGWGRYRSYDWSVSPRYFPREWRVRYYYPYTAPSYISYTAYYPQAQTVEGNTMKIQMHVPSDSRVWIEGEETSTSGAVRNFVSPPLDPGREYVYHIRVQWDENGKAVERKREVKVHAGDRINLNFDK
jgi:uncharacterized protein (TIGR03000 family)